jgi:hypothetical protein
MNNSSGNFNDQKDKKGNLKGSFDADIKLYREFKPQDPKF